MNVLPVEIDREQNVLTVENELFTGIRNFNSHRSDSAVNICWAGIAATSSGIWSSTARNNSVLSSYIPVFVSSREHKKQFDTYSLAVIRPVLHHLSPYPENNEECYQRYLKVNALFAETLIKHLRPGDFVWIHNYQLLPLAAMLRLAMPELAIGFSLHETFPPLQRLSWMPRPWLEEILKGMLGADLIGFRSRKCLSHFLQSILMILDLESENNIIHYEKRLVRLGVFSRDSFQTVGELNQESLAPDFITDLENIKHRQKLFKTDFMNDYSKRDIYDAYRSSTNRMLLLDFEGTLASGNDTPDKEVLNMLGELGRKKGNDIFLASNKGRAWTETHFGSLPVNMFAEYGAWFKPKKGQWIPVTPMQEGWKEDIYRLLEKYVRRCTGSFIVEKTFSLMWNYTQADAGEARLVSFELAGELNNSCDQTSFEIVREKKAIGIRQRNTDKEKFIKQAIDDRKYNFIFVASNDRADENVFRDLRDTEHAFTIKIGPDASFARYNLYTPHMVVSLLQGMNVLSREPVTQ